MKNLSKEQRSFIGAGCFFGLAMFVVMLFSHKEISPPILILGLFGICFVGGVFFGGSLFLLYRFSIRFGGARKIQPRVRTKKERFISFSSTLFAALPLIIVLLTEQYLLWPMLASSIAPFMLMLPLISQKPNNIKLVVRTIASIFGAFFIFIFIFVYFINEGSFKMAPLVIVVAACSSILWCISYFLSIYANRPNA